MVKDMVTVLGPPMSSRRGIRGGAGPGRFGRVRRPAAGAALDVPRGAGRVGGRARVAALSPTPAGTGQSGPESSPSPSPIPSRHGSRSTCRRISGRPGASGTSADPGPRSAGRPDDAGRDARRAAPIRPPVRRTQVAGHAPRTRLPRGRRTCAGAVVRPLLAATPMDTIVAVTLEELAIARTRSRPPGRARPGGRTGDRGQGRGRHHGGEPGRGRHGPARRSCWSRLIPSSATSR
jgi:hypothetical protein